MSEEKKRPPAWPIVVEVLVGLALVALWVLFFLNRTCVWDFVALIIWAAVLVVAAVFLIRGECKLQKNALEDSGNETA